MMWTNKPAVWSLKSIISVLLLQLSAAKVYHLYWNSSNTRITQSNSTENVFLRDRIVAHCPYYLAQNTSVAETEQSVMYLVSKEGYDKCTVDGSAIPVGVCQSPELPASFSMVIRRYSPLPGGIEFHPAATYYFISTSEGSAKGISNLSGGMCDEKNLRISFTVRYRAEMEKFLISNDSYLEEMEHYTIEDIPLLLDSSEIARNNYHSFQRTSLIDDETYSHPRRTNLSGSPTFVAPVASKPIHIDRHQIDSIGSHGMHEDGSALDWDGIRSKIDYMVNVFMICIIIGVVLICC